MARTLTKLLQHSDDGVEIAGEGFVEILELILGRRPGEERKASSEDAELRAS
jgi:hypothetical protein